jgi:hypothetical protein
VRYCRIPELVIDQSIKRFDSTVSEAARDTNLEDFSVFKLLPAIPYLKNITGSQQGTTHLGNFDGQATARYAVFGWIPRGLSG